jgi:hypothetical protein
LVPKSKTPNLEEYIVLICRRGEVSVIIVLIFRFKIPLPKDILPEGDHRVLVDSSKEYFGKVAQKKSTFENQSVLTSSRTAEKIKKEKDMAKEKKRISKIFDDDMKKLEYCKKFVAQFKENENEERMKKVKHSKHKEKEQIVKEDESVSDSYDDDDESVSDSDEIHSDNEEEDEYDSGIDEDHRTECSVDLKDSNSE